MIYLSLLIKFWKEMVIAILIILLLGLMMHFDSKERKYQKQLVDKDLAYVSLKENMSNKLLEQQNQTIQKINDLNKEYTILKEKHSNAIKQFGYERNALNSDINRLSEQVYNIGNRNSSDKDSNSSSTTSVPRGELRSLQDTLILCTTRYADMAEDSDKLQNSVVTLQDAWKQLEEKYNQ